MKTETTPVKVGLFGIGLDTYWAQFKGLKDNLMGYQARIADRLRGFGVTLVDAGLWITPSRLARQPSYSGGNRLT